MTEVLTRSPLDSLSMSAAQTRPRRTSARLGENDEDEPPTKRQKTDKAPRAQQKQVNGKRTATMAKQSERIYDQSEGDFTFTKKTKKATTEAKQPAPVIDEEPQAARPAQAQIERKRKSKSLEPPAPPAANEPRRRSKRISGEGTSNESVTQQKRAEVASNINAQEKPRGRPRQDHQTPKEPKAGNELHVDKKRRATKIALPFADTPVIQRNREMRQTSSDNRRRSSSTMRGRRASSLIDNGVSNAVPHETVETAEFYKHISQDLPEPRRMKQLLTWCGARSLTERPSDSGDTATVNATLAARLIQDELLRDFANKSEMSDWFSREEDVAPVVLVKKPNPRNTQNAAKLVELEQEVAHLEQEKATWDSLLGSLSSSMTTAVSAKAAEAIDESQLSNPDQAQCLRVLSSQTATTDKTKLRLQEKSDALEFKIDGFAGGIHKLEQLEGVVIGTVGIVMQEASSALEERDKARTGNKDGASVGETLRALSRAASS